MASDEKRNSINMLNRYLMTKRKRTSDIDDHPPPLPNKNGFLN